MTTNRLLGTILCAAVGATWTATAHAQDAPSPSSAPAPAPAVPVVIPVASPAITQVPVDDYRRKAKELDDQLNAVLSIPETPAAFALGVSPETVAHPGTVRDAVAAVTAHFGSDGRLKPGLAIEGAPFRPLFAKYDVDQWMTMSTWPMQVLDSVRVSLATAEDPAAPAGGMVPTLASAGLRVSLLDQRDYRHNPAFVKSVRDTLTKCFPGPTPPAGAGGPAFTAVPIAGGCDAANLKTSLDDLTKMLTNGHRIELAAAVTVAQGQNATTFDWRSSRAWLAYDWGFTGGTIGAAVDGQLRDAPDGRRVKDLTGGVRVSFDHETVSWSLGALYGRIGQTADQSDKVARYGTALSLKVPSYGVSSAGIQGNHDFDTHADGAILFLSLTTANGESVFARAYAAGAAVP